MFIIAGLGNPSKQYERTRHNVGFDVIDLLSEKYNIKVNEKKHRALCGTGWIEGQKVLLVKPQTFMNLSGESTQEFLRIKIGVGEKPQGWDLADYVLGRFSKEERKLVTEAFEKVCDAVALMVRGETDQAMNLFN